MDVDTVARDLREEQQALDVLVADLSGERWSLATPSPRWSIADQIAHLTYFDESATRAIMEPDVFVGDVERLWAAATAGDAAMDDITIGEYRALSPPELLERWRCGRRLLLEAAATLAEDTRVAWYGPSMGSKSFLTARLMETWAHGQDVADALGLRRPATDRLRHIARLGFITREWSYANRGLTAPEEPVRVELTAPNGDRWGFGPADAAARVTGSAAEFCLVVVQRRHLDDTQLEASPLAREWLLIAQAFAGPPTIGPDPGARVAADG